MDIKKKNLITALVLGLIAVAIYVFALVKAIHA